MLAARRPVCGHTLFRANTLAESAHRPESMHVTANLAVRRTFEGCICAAERWPQGLCVQAHLAGRILKLFL